MEWEEPVGVKDLWLLPLNTGVISDGTRQQQLPVPLRRCESGSQDGRSEAHHLLGGAAARPGDGGGEGGVLRAGVYTNTNNTQKRFKCSAVT